MEKTTRLILWVAVGVAVLIATTQPAVAVIVNGEFDDPVGPDDNFGWTTSGGILYNYPSPQKNVMLVEGDGVTSILSQMVTLGEDDNWLSFYLFIRSETGADCDIFTATFDGDLILPIWSNHAGAIIPPPGTITFDVSGYYDASDPSHQYELMFRLEHDIFDYQTGITIDTVELTTGPPMVPVPGALLLGGLGSVLVVLLRRYV